jgi:hypothetical protein
MYLALPEEGRSLFLASRTVLGTVSALREAWTRYGVANLDADPWEGTLRYSQALREVGSRGIDEVCLDILRERTT